MAPAAGAKQPAVLSRNVVLAFMQPVAMGVLLGQGWHVYSEVLNRGSAVSFGVCFAGAALGLAVSSVLCARTDTGQTSLRLSLFWMACTLTGGLAGIAQLRLRVGRFRANDDALVVNSFLSSGLLGTSLPHIVLKIVRQPGAGVLMPCVLALLMTEAICSSETYPWLQVGVSLFLFAVGLQGIVSDNSMAEFVGGAAAGNTRSGAKGEAGAGAASGGALEPFFPATAMDSRAYSPHFLVSRKQHYVPNGTALVPLISLVVRQAPTEAERGKGERGGKGKGKDRDKGGGDSRERRNRDRAASDELATQAMGQDAEEAVRQKGGVAAADVGSDIRWDVLLEEMTRVDGGKSGAARKGSGDSGDGKGVKAVALDEPVEVCAELTGVEGEEEAVVEGVPDRHEARHHPPSSAKDFRHATNSKQNSSPNEPQIPAALQERLDKALAAARDAASEPADEVAETKAPDDAEPGSATKPKKQSTRKTKLAREALEKEREEELAKEGKATVPESSPIDAHLASLSLFSDKAAEPPKQSLSLFADEPAVASNEKKKKKNNLSLFADEPAEAPKKSLSLFADEPTEAPKKKSLSLFADEPAEPPKKSLSLFADEPAESTVVPARRSQFNVEAVEFVPPSGIVLQAETAVPAKKSSLSLFADEPSETPVAVEGAQEVSADQAYMGLSYGGQEGSWVEGVWVGASADATQAQGFTGDMSAWEKPWDMSFGDSGDAAAWNGYAYGGMANSEYAGFGYAAGADAAGGYVNEAGMWVPAEGVAEFVPGMWGTSTGQEGMTSASTEQEASATRQPPAPGPPPGPPRPHDPAMSLFGPDPSDDLDPGCGRASAVRQQDFDEDRRARGKGGGKKSGPPRTLWVGDIGQQVSEDYLQELFSTMQIVTNVKIIRDRGGFAFIEFASHNSAVAVLEELKGAPIVGQDGRKFRVNWASEKQSDPNHGDGADNWGGYNSMRGLGPDSRSNLDAAAEGKGKGKKGKDGKGDGSKGGSSRTWAYLDPNGDVQVGMSMDEMRDWYLAGYFEAELQVAIMPEAAGGRKPKAPNKRDFYALRHWYSDLSKAFTYMPKF